MGTATFRSGHPHGCTNGSVNRRGSWVECPYCADQQEPCEECGELTGDVEVHFPRYNEEEHRLLCGDCYAHAFDVETALEKHLDRGPNGRA